MSESLPYRLDIDVTFDDIRNGTRGHWSDNAIGLAIKRTLPGCYVEVSDYITTIVLADERGRYAVPSAMRRFLERDAHGPIEHLTPQPFTLYRLGNADDDYLRHNTRLADALYSQLRWRLE